MALRPGAHQLGPSNGSLRIRTYRQGFAAKAGHDLVLEAREWRGSVVVPDDPAGAPSVTVEVDLPSIYVVEGSGGVKPLSDGDKDEIRRSMRKPLHVDEFPTAKFRSTDVRVEGDDATLEGELSLAGQAHALELQLHRAQGGAIVGHAEIVQTTWGIKPYTGFLGALKLRDAVDLDVTATLAD